MTKLTRFRPDIAVVIYTYDRTDDAKINQEIIRNLWDKSGFFGNIKIIHAYNGKTSWYPIKHLEDILIRRKNSSHYAGASNLIDTGFLTVRKLYPKIKYGIILASDTWLLKPDYVVKLIYKMEQENLCWATCPWGYKGHDEFRDVGAATDCFIINLPWADKYKMLPFNYDAFYKKFAELFYYQSGSNIMLEKLAFGRFINAIFRESNINSALRLRGLNRILTMTDRQPIHGNTKPAVTSNDSWKRNSYWPKIGLATHHEAVPKQKILRQYKIAGASIKKLQTAKNLDYFNQH
ncbi:MAG: hypothetical protein WC553_02300 [Patescibacteria group bacterium]|jgi:hypothetical protein